MSNLICGIGINDSNYPIMSEGVKCKYYLIWLSMLRNVIRTDRYREVDIIDDWLYFMKFRDWCLDQPTPWKIENSLLLRDAVVPFTGVYGPEYSRLIPNEFRFLQQIDIDPFSFLPLGGSYTSIGFWPHTSPIKPKREQSSVPRLSVLEYRSVLRRKITQRLEGMTHLNTARRSILGYLDWTISPKGKTVVKQFNLPMQDKVLLHHTVGRYLRSRECKPCYKSDLRAIVNALIPYRKQGYVVFDINRLDNDTVELTLGQNTEYKNEEK